MTLDELEQLLAKFRTLDYRRTHLEKLSNASGTLTITVCSAISGNIYITGEDTPTILEAMKSAAKANLSQINAEITKMEGASSMVVGPPPDEAEGVYTVDHKKYGWTLIYWNSKLGWTDRSHGSQISSADIIRHIVLPASQGGTYYVAH